MNTAVMFSSATDEWSTPQDFFDVLDNEFGFFLDVAATAENAKTPTFYTAEDDALVQSWHADTKGAACWCNPPYSRGLQKQFIAKAAHERLFGCTTVMLLPARTDTKAFHTHIYDASRWQAREGVEIRFIPGRLKFGGAKDSAPFPSMVVIFRRRQAMTDRLVSCPAGCGRRVLMSQRGRPRRCEACRRVLHCADISAKEIEARYASALKVARGTVSAWPMRWASSLSGIDR